MSDLTSPQDAAKNILYPDVSPRGLRLGAILDSPVSDVTELIVLQEHMSQVKTDQLGTVGKHV